MKVYVDELPKSCFECPCFGNDIDFPCGLSDGSKDYFLDEIDGGECPLKSLADHDRQVRKEVIEGVKAVIDDIDKYGCVKGKDIYDYLDEIGEENAEN